jgi:IrrE N-terminal-like domain
VRAITYQGELVAIATRTRVHLAPDVAALGREHPRLRFIAAMCLYSRDLDTGELTGPYSTEEAELYARCVLLPDEEFERRRHDPDDLLAARFRMPLEQVAAKRKDIAITAAND